jgi:hypothetical protein
LQGNDIAGIIGDLDRQRMSEMADTAGRVERQREKLRAKLVAGALDAPVPRVSPQLKIHAPVLQRFKSAQERTLNDCCARLGLPQKDTVEYLTSIQSARLAVGQMRISNKKLRQLDVRITNRLKDASSNCLFKLASCKVTTMAPEYTPGWSWLKGTLGSDEFHAFQEHQQGIEEGDNDNGNHAALTLCHELRPGEKKAVHAAPPPPPSTKSTRKKKGKGGRKGDAVADAKGTEGPGPAVPPAAPAPEDDDPNFQDVFALAELLKPNSSRSRFAILRWNLSLHKDLDPCLKELRGHEEDAGVCTTPGLGVSLIEVDVGAEAGTTVGHAQLWAERNQREADMLCACELLSVLESEQKDYSEVNLEISKQLHAMPGLISRTCVEIMKYRPELLEEESSDSDSD